jgi:hypothetical protein
VNWLVIENIRPWDGRYEFATPDLWTTREWGWVKRLSGYLPMTVEDGWSGGDPELFAVMAIIALHRAGKVSAAEAPGLFTDRFADVPFGATIRLEADQEETEPEETDAGPPTSSSSGSSSANGDDSRPSSGRSALIPPASGIPASATSTSARPASAR